MVSRLISDPIKIPTKLIFDTVSVVVVVVTMEHLGRRRKIVMAVTMAMALLGRANADMHKVGKSGWIPNYNYTVWSSQEHFYVGDWLYFIFDKRYFNVLEVNKTNYESCNDQNFIANFTRGGRDVVQLTEARPYYFLSSGGYCWGGMKLAVNVEEFRPAAPAAAPAKNGSPSTTGSRLMVLFLAFGVAFTSSVLF